MSYSDSHTRMKSPISYDDSADGVSQKPTGSFKVNTDNHSLGTLKSHSRLNYNSAPFTPKKQFLNSNVSKPTVYYGDTDIVNVSNSLPLCHDGYYYQQGSNVNFDTFSGNITDQSLNFMHYICPFPDAGAVPNYYPMVPNNNYYGPSSNVDSNQKIQTNKTDWTQNNRQSPQKVKPNSPININKEEITQKESFKDKFLDKNINQMNCLNLSKEDPRRNQCIDSITYNEILDSVTDKEIKRRLSETLSKINPHNLLLNSIPNSRFFVIKSYSEDDLHRAIKYGVWSSTQIGNSTLDKVYSKLTNYQSKDQIGRLFLFFSINGSGFFAGIAEMISQVYFSINCNFWTNTKWKGHFNIKWHYVKDVRFNSLRHIRSESNDNKPVTNCRDTSEITPFKNGVEFIKIFHNSKYETSIFDDFKHYNDKEEVK